MRVRAGNHDLKRDTGYGRRMGISTLSLKGLTLEKAIHLARKAGFAAFELVPRLYGGPENFDKLMRRELAGKLECFDLVTLHTSEAKLADGSPVDITSLDPSCRRRSIDAYLAHIELALDIGARVITFHPGPNDKQAIICRAQEGYFEFAEIALSAVGGEKVQLGYEFFDTGLSTQIGDSRFGLLFDIGHAAMLFETGTGEGVLKILGDAMPVAVEFHIHGVERSQSGEKTDHLPLDRCNVIDYEKVFKLISGSGFRGPLIFEIGIAGTDAEQNLSDSLKALERCADLMRGQETEQVHNKR